MMRVLSGEAGVQSDDFWRFLEGLDYWHDMEDHVTAVIVPRSDTLYPREALLRYFEYRFDRKLKAAES